MTMAADPPATTAADAPPLTAPPRRRLRHPRPPDRDRTLEILSVLLLYIIAVHYALKFTAFFLPPDYGTPSREELLGMRGAAGVLGLSLEASSSLRARTKRSFNNHVIVLNHGSELLSKEKSSRSWREDRRRGISSLQSSSGSYSITATAHSLSESLREDTMTDTTNEEFVPGAKINSNDKSTNTNKPILPTNTTRRNKRNSPRIPILSYQDDLVIVSKPSGMTMHHNSNTRWGRSKFPVLQTTVHRQLSRKPYLVHRLDHRTSGAVIMGFDSHTAAELHGRLRQSDATKLYVALVRGDLREWFRRPAGAATAMAVSEKDECTKGEAFVDISVDGDGSVVASHGRVPNILTGGGRGEAQPSLRRRINSSSEYDGMISVNLPVKVNGIKKEAQTDFYFLSSMEALDNLDGDEEKGSADDPSNNKNKNAATITTTKIPYVNKSLTLLLCRPRTGRTHQIRRHTQRALQAPVVGDSEHGDSRVNRLWRERIGLDRLGLHCWYLGLPPPSTIASPSRFDSHSEPGGGDGEDGGIECMAPLAADFAEALRHEALRPLWDEATRVEPRLGMDPYDERGGTFGRYYRTRIRGGSEG